MNREASQQAVVAGAGRRGLGFGSAGADIPKEQLSSVSASAGAAVTASTSPADSRSNSERGSPDPVLPPPRDLDGAVQAGNASASELDSSHGSNMNDVSNNNTSRAAEEGEESFDMLAGMPPTPGGGLVAPPTAGDESFADMLGAEDPSPTTPAAVAWQGVRRSPRLASQAAAGSSAGTGGRAINGVKGHRVGLAAGGGAGTGGLTPYSGRRGGQRQAFPERAFTPGTARGDGDDANASFCTAIMGSIDGSSAGDPGSAMRGVSLFSGVNVDDSMAGDSDSTSPVDAGGKAGDLSMTPSLDLNLSSVEERVAGLELAGDATTASPPGANASGMDDDANDVTPPGGDAADADLALGKSTSSPITGEGTAPACTAALAQKQCLEPPSPAVAPRLSAAAADGSPAAAAAASGKRASFPPKDTAAAEAAPSAEVSPYGARGKLGGGLSTSSTFGASSDDRDDDFMATEFATGAGVGAPVAEMTLPTLPKVEETLPGQQQQQQQQQPAPPAAVDMEGGVDGAAAPGASSGGGGSVDAESSVILDEMLVAATGGGLGCASRAGMNAPPPGAGAGPPTPADNGKGGAAVVVSAVEKEAMALAAACVAQQEALNKAPETAEVAATGTEKKAAGVEREGGNEEPEIAGGESGGDKRNGDEARKGKAPAAVPSKQAVGGGAEAKLGGGGMKNARVSISRVAVPAAVSARRGSSSSSLRPPSPSRSKLRPPSPARSSVRPPSPARGSVRPPSPSRSSSSSVRPPSPSRGSALRPPSPSATQRWHSMAYGSRVDGSGSAAAAAAAAAAKRTAAVEATKEKAAAKAKAAPVVAVPVKRASSRGRDRVGRERASVGGVSRGRYAGTSAGGAASAAPAAPAPAPADAAPAPAPAPVVVAAVDPSSRLLAPTKLSQGRARPRSASPSVSSTRGRASTGGFGGPRGSGPGVNRRVSTAGPTPLQQRQQKLQQKQQEQEQQQQARPRSASTGRRALTMPKTPNFRTSSRAKTDKPQETSEEAEFRKQQAMQEQLKQMTRRNQVVMERSRRTAYSGNVRSSKPLTVPESPAMKTVGRLGGKVYATVGPKDQVGFSPTHPAKNDPLSKDNLAQLAAQPKGPTVPAPFQLSKSNRPSSRDGGSAPGTPRSKEDHLTFRESLARLENKTPDRFRTRPVGEQPRLQPVARVEAKPTLPKSPKFRTEARAAGYSKAHFPSREEREEAELAEMKKHQFKALPYNADGFGVGGEQGVFRPQHSDKQLTQPTPFHLSSEDRASRRAPSPHRSRDEEELSKKFKARPMPGGRSSSVGRVRPGANVGAELKPRELTLASSPTFATKRRSALRSNSVGGGGTGGVMLTSEELELEKAAANKFRARPMPDYSRLSQSRRQSVAAPEVPPAPTEPRPFNLRSDARGKAKQALLAKRMLDQRRQQDAAARVRARPLPTPSNGFCPQPSDRPLTETSEFCLSSQARHEKAAQEFQDRVRKEEERARRATEVIALPLPAATFEPELYPERTEVSLTQPVERVLHSSARAEGRAKWDEENQARQAHEERVKREQEEAAAAAERRSISELRRRSHADGGMSFKAKPIKWNSAPPEVAQLSTAPLTTPVTPNLRTKRRAMNNAAEPREPAPAPIA